MIGAIPHYEFTREYAVSSLNYAFSLAQDYGLLMDVHCDEIDDGASRGWRPWQRVPMRRESGKR